MESFRFWAAFGAALVMAGCGSSSTTGGDPVDAATSAASDGGVADASTNNPTPPDAGTWSLSGTIRGIDLQKDVRSAVASKVDTGAALFTTVTLVNLDGYCALTRANQSCPSQGSASRQAIVKILGTAPGKYKVTEADSPSAGTATVRFLALGKDCEAATSPVQLLATGGTVTFDTIDFQGEHKASLSMDVTTSEGRVSGTIEAPTCD